MTRTFLVAATLVVLMIFPTMPASALAGPSQGGAGESKSPYCQDEPHAEPCVECTPEYYGQPCYPKSQNYDGGNYVCDYGEYRQFFDTDGDGTLDCLDPDDDNDRLSDEVEMTYLFRHRAAALVRDQDGDGIGDGADLHPLVSGGKVTVSLTFGNYYRNGETCDCCGDYSDPYFSHIAISQLPIGIYNVAIPDEWSEGGHTDDRSDGKANIQASTDVSADIEDWGFDFWQLPKIRVEAIMFDHDTGLGGADDPIDLTPEAGTGGLVKSGTLSEPTKGTWIIAGNEPCRAKFEVVLLDNVLGKFARAAVAYRSTGGPYGAEPVQMVDVYRVQG